MSGNRILSGLVSVIYVVIGALHGGAEMAFKIGLGVIMPPGCIWFLDAMGRLVGGPDGSRWFKKSSTANGTAPPRQPELHGLPFRLI
jgi:hypothetical protein